VNDCIVWSVGLSVVLSPSEPYRKFGSDRDTVCIQDSDERPITYSGSLGGGYVLCLFNTIQPSSFDRYILLCKTQRSNIKAVQQSVNTLIILLINKANIFIKDLT